ncbi:FAD-dependent monooxygenase [Spongiactinospora rosea]|uniref:FAD-dependent monooxygenase n=1 Tax=Spongiactinospora rosea TaxID=2248750 RepID=A0A366LSN6_9ACTN|nr:FAD-dependent monooxygenase [Spongiactinospora rosea]RBQ16324.1 FAD-dependent monooxygenase [Spongiactinospora rosea]
MRVIVIGAGLGGLTLAQGLHRAGIDVVVYERDRVEGRPQGISLHMDDRGAAALRACLPHGHAAMAEATMGGARREALALAETDGRLTVQHARPLDGAPGTARPGRQADRPLLRAVLLTGLEDRVRFGARFTRFKRRPDGTVRAWFADGGTDTADVLVGADGIGSAVRRQYLPHVRVLDTGRHMLMGATPLRAVADVGLPALIGHNSAAMRMHGRMMALGVLRFSQPPVAARDRWLPALRGPAVTAAEDYVMWALPVTGEWPDLAGPPAERWHRARKEAEALHPDLRSIVGRAWPDVTVALRGATIPAMAAWSAGPVTVLGDAIHAAPGFGGNLAMQDAHRLRDALVQAARGEGTLLAAIGAYEDAMRRDGFPATDVPREKAGTGVVAERRA